mmetsp:Transcript_25247/g.79207  ORF Transcript_25247/g.79207 Transcript_25247/m.79207 type:complete len:329 (-) Transcript_25247:276-1262(-)
MATVRGAWLIVAFLLLACLQGPPAAATDSECCSLGKLMDVDEDLQAFRRGYGEERYPCCSGVDVQGESKAETFMKKMRQFYDAHANSTILVSGDSISRQTLMSLLCALERELNQTPAFGRDSDEEVPLFDLAAKYPNGLEFVRVVIETRKATSLDLDALLQTLRERGYGDGSSPPRFLLVGGGIPALALHHFRYCRGQSSTKCREMYGDLARGWLAKIGEAHRAGNVSALLVTTPPQHFPASQGTGRFEFWLKASRKKRSTTRKCGPINDKYLSQHPHGHWRNTVSLNPDSQRSHVNCACPQPSTPLSRCSSRRRKRTGCHGWKASIP